MLPGDSRIVSVVVAHSEGAIKNDLVAYRANIQAVNNHGYPEAFRSYAEVGAGIAGLLCCSGGWLNRTCGGRIQRFFDGALLELFQQMELKESDTRFFDYRYTVVAFPDPQQS